MKKRSGLVCVILAAVILALSLTAFFFLESRPSFSKYQLSGDRKFSVSNLDEVVERIRGALKERGKSITLLLSLEGDYMDDISPLVKELMELAYLPTGDPLEGDYLKYQIGGYHFSYGHEPAEGGFEYAITIVPDYYTTKEQETLVSEKVEEILASLHLPFHATDEEKIRAAYDYLTQHVSYDKVHQKNEFYTLKSTAYAALVNKSATCLGYAVSLCRLLSELGVECRIIKGEGIKASGSELHAWNVVRIGDLFYNIDATWNSSEEADYYLKGSEDFPNHIPDEEYSGLYPLSQFEYKPS